MKDVVPKKKRTRTIFAIIAVLLLLLTSLYLENLIQGKSVRIPIANNIIIFALVNINIILLMVLLLLLFRNILKLYFERRGRIPGAKFRTKIIISFIGLSLAPSILLFLVASGLISRSIDSWFNVQVERALSETMDVSQSVYKNYEKNALYYSERFGLLITDQDMLSEMNIGYLINTAKRLQTEYLFDSVQVFNSALKQLVMVKNPDVSDKILVKVDSTLLSRALKGENITEIKSFGESDAITGVVPIWKSRERKLVTGVIATTYYIPTSLVSKMNNITSTFDEYKQLKILKNPITTIHIISFLIVTLLIVFAGTWIGFQLARGITIPIEQLAEGTRRIAEGDLEFKIDVKADDEVGVLVDSFNQMTEDLRNSKIEIIKANEDLKDTNIELDRRSNYTETILKNIATGVISFNKQGRITTINSAAARTLNIYNENVVGRHYREVFDTSQMNSIRALIKHMSEIRRENIEKQISISVEGRQLTLITRVNILRDSNGKFLGLVVAFDDITELIKAQKIAAWREVAQGIAHEIKNPLTPIQLSAQRLRKKYGNLADMTDDVFNECTHTIIKQVDELKELLHEFSRFARMPESNPVPCDLHNLIDDVLLLYNGSHKDVTIEKDFDPEIRMVNLDYDQMKRVFINLIENSLDAMDKKGIIKIRTRLNRVAKRITIEVLDSGTGVHISDRERLFMPYFSTKSRGTGLGLAIVHRIVSDHNGTIRVKENEFGGASFLIELNSFV